MCWPFETHFQMEAALLTSLANSQSISAQVLQERDAFELQKRDELKVVLGKLADAQIQLYQEAMDDWDKVIPVLSRIRVDT